MKKMLLAAALLTASMAITPAHAYSALALGQGGAWGFAYNYPTMESARSAARNVCRRNGGGSCSATVAERDNWYFSGAYCDDEPYVAASGVGFWRSDEIAEGKGNADGRYDCFIQVNK